jgi:hypothetical protein
VPFDWIEDPRTPRPEPQKPDWRKVIIVLGIVVAVVVLAIWLGELVRG